METFNTSDAKRKFDAVLSKAQHSPVNITQNGETIAVVISATEYTFLQALREKQFYEAIQEGIADLKSGKVREGATVINNLRARARGDL